MEALWRAVKRGVGVVAVLVSATAVINTIVDWLAISPSGWLDAWVNAYRGVFYPLLDATIGRVLGLFGYELADWARNLSVFYLAFGASLLRTGEKEGKAPFYDKITMVVFWPFLLLFVVFESNAEEIDDSDVGIRITGFHGGSKNPLSRGEIFKSFGIELGQVALLVAATMLLHASGVLT